MKYRVVINSSLDKFGQTEVEPYKEYNTLKEARKEVKDFYKYQHFNCYNQYYIQHFKNGKWVYLDKKLQKREEEKLKPIVISTIDYYGDKIELPFKIELTKIQANHGKLALFTIIKKLVEYINKEK